MAVVESALKRTQYLRDHDSATDYLRAVPDDLAGRREDHALRAAIQMACNTKRGKRFRYGSLYRRHGKPLFDRVCAAGLLVGFAPVLAIIAVAIRLDSPGPAFFIQERTGLMGRRFRLYKFRTMVVDAEERKAELLEHNIHGSESPDFKLADDPRVTRLGQLLRKTSLDELPNLINVVTGDLSLVGPRPTSFHANTYARHHLVRLAVRPGITGLWQVNGRADVGFDERTRLDVQYMRSSSLFTDLQLILRTALGANKGAY